MLSAYGPRAVQRAPDTPQLPASATASHRAIADFMGALATRSDALEPDLRRLFSALQDAPEFALFRNASPYRQHDAADFAEGLIAAMDLDNQPSHRLRLCRIPGAGLPTEPYGLPTSLVNVRLERHDGGLDLQSILNKSLSDMPAHSGKPVRPARTAWRHATSTSCKDSTCASDFPWAWPT